MAHQGKRYIRITFIYSAYVGLLRTPTEMSLNCFPCLPYILRIEEVDTAD